MIKMVGLISMFFCLMPIILICTDFGKTETVLLSIFILGFINGIDLFMSKQHDEK